MPLQLTNLKRAFRADENIDDVASGFNRSIRALGNFNKVRALPQDVFGKRNPEASSSSWPGVRMVRAMDWPRRRISNGSSVTTESEEAECNLPSSQR